MSRIQQLLATFVGIGLLFVSPTLAQTSVTAQSGAPTSVPGSLERVQNAWPARNLIGASVFNDNGRRVATVRDLLLTDDGKVERVVLAVGARGRLIAVAFGQLKFVPNQPIPGRMSRMVDPERRPYGIMLPGATQASLLQMESILLTPDRLPD